MLPATYVLLTLSAEQKTERNFISSIQHYLRANAARPQQIDPAHLQVQLEALSRFAETRHQHRLAACLIPAVREATPDAAPLLADLESLSRHGSKVLRSVRRRLRLAFLHGASNVNLLCRTLERYCANLLERLAKEEQELLPLAQRVISSEQWFAIGTMFLSDDADHEERTRPAQVAA